MSRIRKNVCLRAGQDAFIKEANLNLSQFIQRKLDELKEGMDALANGGAGMVIVFTSERRGESS